MKNVFWALHAFAAVLTLCRFPLYSQASVTFISDDVYGRRDTVTIFYTAGQEHDRTMSYPGDLPGRFDLSVDPPVENLYEGSIFSRFIRAGDRFDVHSFPARTAIKMGTCKVNPGDTSVNQCSGTLIGDRFVLTSAHCVAGFRASPAGSSVIRTGMKVSVAPANGYCHPYIETTDVVRTYVLKDYVDPANYEGSYYPPNLHLNDMALLELRQPIGRLSGWLGISFYRDSTHYLGKVVHKFATPGASSFFPTRSPGDPSLYYNGDTLYYSYGLLDSTYPMLSLFGEIDDGSPGQSGSPLFFTDNKNQYEIYGTQTLYNSLGHVRMRENFFYGFKHIMESWSDWITDVEEDLPTPSVYPNPFSNDLHIELPEGVLPCEVVVTTLTGIMVGKAQLSSLESTLDLGHLNSGIYLMTLVRDKKITAVKLVKK